LLDPVLALLEKIVGTLNVVGICNLTGTRQQSASEHPGEAGKMVASFHSGSVP
jgi:hypothetical protein